MIVEQSIQTAEQHLRKARELVARAELSPSQLLELEAEAVGELQQARAALSDLEQHVSRCRPNVDREGDLLWAIRELLEWNDRCADQLERSDRRRFNRLCVLLKGAQEADPW